jgi:hypothetical protein
MCQLKDYGCPLVYKTHRKVNLSSYSRDLRSQFWQNWPPIRSVLAIYWERADEEARCRSGVPYTWGFLPAGAAPGQ